LRGAEGEREAAHCYRRLCAMQGSAVGQHALGEEQRAADAVDVCGGRAAHSSRRHG